MHQNSPYKVILINYVLKALIITILKNKTKNIHFSLFIFLLITSLK